MTLLHHTTKRAPLVFGSRTRAAVFVLVGIVAGSAATAHDAMSTPGQRAPTVRVTRSVGQAGQSFTAAGSGCANDGIVTYRVDNGSQNPPITTSTAGAWARSLAFPPGIGAHTFTFTCSDPDLAGAPTTILNPGAPRFTYAAVIVRTTSGPPTSLRGECPQLSAQSTAASPCVLPSGTAPGTAPGAAPVPGRPSFTG